MAGLSNDSPLVNAMLDAWAGNYEAEARKTQAVWEKGLEIPGRDRAVWRMDWAGFYIRRQDYSNRDSDFGWERGHIIDSALGGGDDISNLRPEHWSCNASRGGLLAAALSKG